MMTILTGISLFIAGSSFGFVLAACARGFARQSGEYDRAYNMGEKQ